MPPGWRREGFSRAGYPAVVRVVVGQLTTTLDKEANRRVASNGGVKTFRISPIF
jgi:hypothetical protein